MLRGGSFRVRQVAIVETRASAVLSGRLEFALLLEAAQNATDIRSRCSHDAPELGGVDPASRTSIRTGDLLTRRAPAHHSGRSLQSGEILDAGDVHGD